jgi:hypothetical protein
MLLSGYLKAQLSSERSAWSSLSKQKWVRAHEQLKKILEKDSANAAAHYVMARYFFAPANPQFHIDSAHLHATASLHDYSRLTSKQREKMKRFPLDSIIIIRLLEQVDSAAFHRVQQLNTEAAYAYFIDVFPSAREHSEALKLREKAAFAEAQSIHTHQAFSAYIYKYPEGSQVAEARSLYEKLLFEEKTRDKRLESYDIFLRVHPQTTHRKEAEQHIFEIATASGTIESFRNFLQRYPQSMFRERAEQILYYLQVEEPPAQPLQGNGADSSRVYTSLPRHYLVPFLQKNGYGFMDENGFDVIAPEVDELNDEYRCGNIDEDVVVLPGRVVSRNGTLVYKGEVTSVDDLGSGFLLIENQHCVKVMHKTGFNPGDPCVEDAKVLNGKLLALKKDGKWSVRTLTGLQLIPFEWDNIAYTGDVLIFQRNKQFWLATTETISAIANQESPRLKDAFEEVKPWPNGRIWARAGKFEGVFDQQLNVYIPFREQRLLPAFFGAQARVENQWMIYNAQGEYTEPYDTVLVSKPWAAARTQNKWRLLIPLQHLAARATYDSVFFAGTFAVGIRNDSTFIQSTEGKTLLKVKGLARIEFVPAQDSSAFFILDHADKRILYNHAGQKLFAVVYDRIHHAGKNIFVVIKRDKKGLVAADGKLLLLVEYDAIGMESHGTVSLLKAKKFGLYDVQRKKLIKPEYGKNLSLYNERILVALKNGSYGFIGWDNKPLSNFEFAEVQPWNDTLAWVKKNFMWMLYNLKTKKTQLDRIRNMKLILDKANERLAIVQQDNAYGVIHNTKGMIIPLNFSDIVNVGSPEKPMYFTEKHVEEASVFVVIYYNHEGKFLRKEIYEQDDYEKIYCSDHK